MRSMGDTSTPLTSTAVLNTGAPVVMTASSATVPGTNLPAAVTPAAPVISVASLGLTQPPMYYAAILAAVYLLLKG